MAVALLVQLVEAVAELGDVDGPRRANGTVIAYS